MKERWLILLIVCFSSILGKAGDHYMGFSAGMGWHTSYPMNRSSNAGETDFQLAYEYSSGKFLLQTGVTVGYELGIAAGRECEYIFRDMIDSEHEVAEVHLTLLQQKTNYRGLRLSIPIMLGCQWHSTYLLVGCHFRGRVNEDYRNMVHYSIFAQYPFYDSPVTDVPAHGLVNNSYQESKIVFTGYSLQPLIEVGYDFRQLYYGPVTRLGVYCGYNIPFQRFPQMDLSRLEGSRMELLQTSLHDYDEAFAAVMRRSCLFHASLGVRLTVLFPLVKHRICRCYSF